MEVIKQPHIEKSIYFAYGTYLIMEWILSLHLVAPIKSTTPFLLFAFFCFIITFSSIGLLLKGVANSCLILVILFDQFGTKGQSFFQFLPQLVEQLKLDYIQITHLFARDISFVTQTLGGLLLLWAMISIYGWGSRKHQAILPFFISTAIYVLTLDSFFQFDGFYVMIRLVVISFVLLTTRKILSFQSENSRFDVREKAMAILCATAIIGTTGIGGYMGPKYEEKWEDPIQFIQTYGETRKTAGIHGNDEVLGGSFDKDNRVVYKAIGKKRVYYIYETKSTYTGKGWTQSSMGPEIILGSSGQLEYIDSIPLFQENPVVESTKLYNKSKDTILLHPKGSIKYEYEKKDFVVKQDINRSINQTFSNSKPKPVNEYTVFFYDQSVPISLLKYEELPGLDYPYLELSPDLTQLPLGLPKRVFELSHALTYNEFTQYEKVKAIENYLKSSSFKYEREGIPYPTENQDYVDQFLFDTKKGYCNNFSTAMIVLLRASNIPARWVKGYTPGEFVKTNPKNGERTYEITNDNAHSWVEVFFPTAGWIAFDPTPGFNGGTRVINDQLKPGQPSKTSPETKGKNKQLEKKLNVKPDEEEKITRKLSLKEQFEINQWKLFLLGGILFLIILLRKKWFPYYYILFYGYRKSPTGFESAYRTVLKQLERIGWKKEAGQSLRDFSKQMDRYYGTHEFSELTIIYEQLTYSENADDLDYEEAMRNYRSLIRKF